jgi:hypothetical protein
MDEAMTTTAFTLDGYRIVESLGVVRGVTVRSRSRRWPAERRLSWRRSGATGWSPRGHLRRRPGGGRLVDTGRRRTDHAANLRFPRGTPLPLPRPVRARAGGVVGPDRPGLKDRVMLGVYLGLLGVLVALGTPSVLHGQATSRRPPSLPPPRGGRAVSAGAYDRDCGGGGAAGQWATTSDTIS